MSDGWDAIAKVAAHVFEWQVIERVKRFPKICSAFAFNVSPSLASSPSQTKAPAVGQPQGLLFGLFKDW